jgi:hypothetical protein
MHKIILLVAVISGTPQLTRAQDFNALRQGARIDVTPFTSKHQVGTLILVTGDSLFYTPEGREQSKSIALSKLRLIKVSQGRSHSSGALRGFIIGTLVGAAGGATIAAATWKEDSMDFFCGGSRGACAAFGAGMGGVFGLATGTLFGALAGTERWQSVQLPRQ